MKIVHLNTVNKESINHKKHFAIVDDEDFERVNKYKWYIRAGYALTKINGGTIAMHNLIMESSPIDHKDHNKLNNQKSNLRKCTQHQNTMNSRPRKNKSSEYKGVSWHTKAGKWQASISPNGKRIYLGLFETEIQAGRVYNENAKKYFGEFAYLNNI